MKDIDINLIIDNYRFIKSLNLVDIKELNILLFGQNIINEEDIVEIITNSIEEDEVLPEYSDILNIDNKLLLRDRFVYFLVNGIDEDTLKIYSNDDYKSMEIIDENNNFTDYGLLYPTYNNLLKNRTYKEYFFGVSNKLFKLLNSINYTFYEKITDFDENVISFINSLDTIKNWNKLDIYERKNKLVNEIIGRLLYSSVEYASTKYKEHISKEKFINSKDFYPTLKNIKLTNKLLESSKNIDYKNELVINKVIELYPYSVEIFDKKYITKAKEYGYLFDTKLVNCSYYLFNNLKVELIPIRDRYNYLNYLNNLFNKYKNNKNKDNLYNYLIGLDTYIRNNNYYDKDINLYNNLSLEIFNKDKFDKVDCIRYISKLIKKYYDSTLNTTIGTLVIDLLPISLLDIKIDKYEEINTLRDIYIDLYENYKINVFELNEIINNKRHLYDTIMDFYKSNELIIVTDSLINSNKLDDLFNELIMITNNKIDSSIKEKYYANSSDLIIMLKKICDTEKTTRDYMNIYLEERNVMGLIQDV